MIEIVTVLVDVVVVDVRQKSPAVGQRIAEDLAGRGLGDSARLLRALLQGEVVVGRGVEQAQARTLAQTLRQLGAEVVLRSAKQTTLPKIRSEESLAVSLPTADAASSAVSQGNTGSIGFGRMSESQSPLSLDAILSGDDEDGAASVEAALRRSLESAAQSGSDAAPALTTLDGSDTSGVRPLPPSLAHVMRPQTISPAPAKPAADSALEDAPTSLPIARSPHDEELELDRVKSPVTVAPSPAAASTTAASFIAVAMHEAEPPRPRFLGRDAISAILFGAALGLLVGTVVAYESVRRDARSVLPPLEEELAHALANPQHVERGKLRSPAAIESELAAAWDGLRSHYWTLCLALGIPLGFVFGWVKRREPLAPFPPHR